MRFKELAVGAAQDTDAQELVRQILPKKAPLANSDSDKLSKRALKRVRVLSSSCVHLLDI